MRKMLRTNKDFSYFFISISLLVRQSTVINVFLIPLGFVLLQRLTPSHRILVYTVRYLQNSDEFFVYGNRNLIQIFTNHFSVLSIFHLILCFFIFSHVTSPKSYFISFWRRKKNARQLNKKSKKYNKNTISGLDLGVAYEFLYIFFLLDFIENINFIWTYTMTTITTIAPSPPTTSLKKLCYWSTLFGCFWKISFIHFSSFGTNRITKRRKSI